MSTLSKPYTFSPNTPAVAAQIDANEDTLYGWVNTDAIWADASRSFTVVPSGPSADPTAPNHLTRKSYVDARVTAAVVGQVTNGTASNAILIQGGRISVTTDSGGNFTFDFPTAFPSSCFSVVATMATSASGLLVCQMSTLINRTGFGGRVFVANTGAASATTYPLDYQALGT